MRITAMIFATLFLLVTAAIGFLATNRGLKDASAIDKLVGPDKALIAAAASQSKEAQQLHKLSESTGTLRAGAVFYGIAGLVALALLVLMFANKGVPLFAGALVVVALVGTFLSPQYDLGPFAPASARTLGYVIAVLAGLGAASAWGAFTLKRKSVAHA